MGRARGRIALAVIWEFETELISGRLHKEGLGRIELAGTTFRFRSARFLWFSGWLCLLLG